MVGSLIVVVIIGATLSLDDLLIVCAIYPAIAKKSAYPCPPSLSKKYISFMKYVKKMYRVSFDSSFHSAAIAVLEGEAPKNTPTFIGSSILVAQKVEF